MSRGEGEVGRLEGVANPNGQDDDGIAVDPTGGDGEEGGLLGHDLKRVAHFGTSSAETTAQLVTGRTAFTASGWDERVLDGVRRADLQQRGQAGMARLLSRCERSFRRCLLVGQRPRLGCGGIEGYARCGRKAWPRRYALPCYDRLESQFTFCEFTEMYFFR